MSHVGNQILHRQLPSQTEGKVQNNLVIIMRAYFEKPSTNVDWKGLIHKLQINYRFDVNKGLVAGRQLLCDLTNPGLPVAVELLDTISLQYTSDQISWGKSHRISVAPRFGFRIFVPVTFNNRRDGNVY